MHRPNDSFFWLVTVTVLAICCQACAGAVGPINERLLSGGGLPTLNNGASVASIRYVTSQMNVHVGGGFIINKRWVGTAAQCLVNKTPDTTVVAVGRPTITGGTIYSVIQVEMHQNYNPLTLVHDVGVVKTSNEIILASNVALIPLGAPILTSYVANMYGWGSIVANGGMSEILRTSSFNVIDHATCLSTQPFVARRFVTDRHICFRSSTSATCPGDAGGPIVFNNAVVGIISWVEPCVAGQTSVHTSITSYINWFSNFTRDDN